MFFFFVKVDEIMNRPKYWAAAFRVLLKARDSGFQIRSKDNFHRKIDILNATINLQLTQLFYGSPNEYHQKLANHGINI